MRKEFCRGVFGIVLMAGLSAPIVRAADDNAADVYKQALAAAPANADDIAVYKAEHPDPQAVQAILKKGENALALLHKATTVSACDWGVDDTAPNADVSFLKNLRSLSELSYLKVDSDMAAQHPADACDALIDRMILGSRIQKLHLLITFVLGDGCQDSGAAQAAVWLPQLDDACKKELASAIAKLDPAAGKDDVIANESKASPQGLDEKRKLTIDDAILRTTVKLAMLQAGIDSDGTEGSFAKSKDPTDGQPFSYHKLPNGYELSSRAQFRGKAISLTFGKQE